MADRLAVAREARGAVGEIALVLLLADREAEVRARAQAVDALAALRREQGHHVVARSQRAHAVADRLNDARALVPEHRGSVAGRVGAGGGVHVGVAHAARRQPHEHLPGARSSKLELLHDERLAELLEHGGADLHGTIVVAAPLRRGSRAEQEQRPAAGDALELV